MKKKFVTLETLGQIWDAKLNVLRSDKVPLYTLLEKPRKPNMRRGGTQEAVPTTPPQSTKEVKG